MTVLQQLLSTIQGLDYLSREIPLELIARVMKAKPEQVEKDIDHLVALGFVKRCRKTTMISLTEEGRRANLPG